MDDVDPWMTGSCVQLYQRLCPVFQAVEVEAGRRLRGPLTETSADVTVTVRDANDEPPKFSQQVPAVCGTGTTE